MSTVLPFTFFLCLSLGDYVTSEFYPFFKSLLCGLNTIHSSTGFAIESTTSLVQLIYFINFSLLNGLYCLELF